MRDIAIVHCFLSVHLFHPHVCEECEVFYCISALPMLCIWERWGKADIREPSRCYKFLKGAVGEIMDLNFSTVIMSWWVRSRLS